MSPEASGAHHIEERSGWEKMETAVHRREAFLPGPRLLAVHTLLMALLVVSLFLSPDHENILSPGTKYYLSSYLW